MRLWHKDLIKYLPSSQLVAQWRELNSIYKKQDNHLLINYIYNYPKSTLKTYSDLVIDEMKNREYNIQKWDNYIEYFKGVESDGKSFDEHNEFYLDICFYNLTEKYIRLQKDYSSSVYAEMYNYYQKVKGVKLGWK